MRVLNLSNVAGKKRGGGVHEVVHAFLLGQLELNLDTHLWFPGFKEEEKELIRSLQVKDRRRVRALETTFSPDFSFVKDRGKLRIEACGFDIIHQHGIWLPVSRISSYARKKGKSKLVVQPHGYLEPYALSMSRLKKRLSYSLFERTNLQLADVLVACSHDEYVNLREHFPSKDIAIIPNGIKRSFLESPLSENYFDNVMFNGKKNMLFLSRIHPLKGLERLLQAYSQVIHNHKDSWNLIIAGIGEDAYIQKLKDISNNLGLNESVFFIGPVFGEEKVSVMSSADFFILPTFSENYGIVIAESLSRGVPVLTTKGAPWSLLSEKSCGFHVENNFNGIKEGLEQIFDLSHDEILDMGEQGLKIAKKHFSWESIVPKTRQLYDWLMDKSIPKPDFVYSGVSSSKGSNIF